MSDVAGRAREILDRLGVADPFDPTGTVVARSPVDGSEIGRLPAHTADQVAAVIDQAQLAFEQWRTVPAPVRGQLVRELGLLLREHKADLGALVSIEAGKIRSEGLGEVQEMIDICDLAVGLSRQLFGLTIASERPGHRMMEQWHPLGVVGVITAFNFPVAVWSWNTALALVCGDAVVWKPSEKTPLTGAGLPGAGPRGGPAGRRPRPPDGRPRRCGAGGRGARRRPPGRAGVRHRLDPDGQDRGAAGGRPARPAAARAGRQQRRDRDSLGRSRPRRARHRLLGRRHGRAAVHVTAPGDRALGRSGDDLVDRLVSAYETLPIGSPLEPSTLVGPLVDEAALDAFEAAVRQAVDDGGDSRRRGRPRAGRGRRPTTSGRRSW